MATTTIGATLDPRTTIPDPWPADLAIELAPRYRLEGRIGEGGFGVVYRARHTVLGRRVALKVLRSEIGGSGALLERFRREAMSASSIESPHVVSVIDFGQLPSDLAYIVMELLEGRTLADEFEVRPSFTVKRAVHIARQLCDALSAAHRMGITHRDLKPENIFLTSQNGDPDFVKVVDFGLAKIAGATAITMIGRIMGTAQYMSPEQCSGDEVDARSDIYSFGIVLYEMLTGRVPFEHDGLHELINAHLREPPPLPRVLRSDLSPALEAVILRCLEKQRDDRFQSMDAVRRALDAAMQEETREPVIGERPIPLIMPAPKTPVRKQPPRNVPFAAILVVCAIVGLFLGAVLGIGVRAAANQLRRDPPALAGDNAIHAEI